MVCDVPEPEERFNIDEYSEMVILNKPVIYISIGELINTHKVCLITLFVHIFYVKCSIKVVLLFVLIAFVFCSAFSCCWSTRMHCVLIRKMLSSFC